MTENNNQIILTEEQVSNLANSNSTGLRLKAYIDRVERLEEEKANISEDIKEVYSEAKSDGFDTKIVRKLVAIRKKDQAELAEENALLETYANAIGMEI